MCMSLDLGMRLWQYGNEAINTALWFSCSTFLSRHSTYSSMCSTRTPAKRRCLIGLGFPLWKTCYRERTVRKHTVSCQHLTRIFSKFTFHHYTHIITFWCTSTELVSNQTIRKSERGSGRLGWKCTVCPEWRRASDWFMIAFLCECIGNTSRNPLVLFKEMKNSGICWWEKLLEHNTTAHIGLTDSYIQHVKVPEIKSGCKLIITNSIHSVQYISTPAYLLDPLSDFLRVWFWDYMHYWASSQGWTFWTILQF